MSVLSVATKMREGETREASRTTESNPSDSKQTVDVAERITKATEDYLDGLVPVKYRFELDWGTLAPIISTLSAVVTTLLALRGML